jgi:hypothetical protein
MTGSFLFSEIAALSLAMTILFVILADAGIQNFFTINRKIT